MKDEGEYQGCQLETKMLTTGVGPPFLQIGRPLHGRGARFTLLTFDRRALSLPILQVSLYCWTKLLSLAWLSWLTGFSCTMQGSYTFSFKIKPILFPTSFFFSTGFENFGQYSIADMPTMARQCDSRLGLIMLKLIINPPKTNITTCEVVEMCSSELIRTKQQHVPCYSSLYM